MPSKKPDVPFHATKATGEKKRPGEDLPAAWRTTSRSEGDAHARKHRRRIVAAPVLRADRPHRIEVVTAADEVRGVIATLAHVGVAEAAFQLDAVGDPAAQAHVDEIAVVIGLEASRRAHVDLRPAEPADEVEALGEAVVAADAHGDAVEVDVRDALARILAEREVVLREADRAAHAKAIRRWADAVDVRLDVYRVDEGIAH